jgi:uncharacterized repeat protein (TIGR02543 family)
MTVYAKWTVIYYTVSFDANGGSPATQTRTVASGDVVGYANMPAEPTRIGYVFDGWHASQNGGGNEFTAIAAITGDITVYAAWWKMPLAEALAWISNNAEESGEYTITVNANEIIAPQMLYYGGKTVGITLVGDTTERTVSLSATGSLFEVGSGVTLTLNNNVVLQGRSDNTAPLVLVGEGGTLLMNTGSKVSGNTIVNSGSGVFIESNGSFAMNGGTISDNTTTNNYGGGVTSYGTFTMSGGTISGNIASYGGGVVALTSGSTFTKQSGGIIYGSNADNALKNTAGNNYGHAVYVDGISHKQRNTTAGVGVTLDSGQSGSAGGWE